MKVLMIGMDGASLETFSRGWTPYMESLIKRGSVGDIYNNLLSRGWVELVTGKEAHRTGAQYDIPLCNGTTQWTTSFSIASMDSDTRPLWESLNKIGVSVGIMNVPTTAPAPSVDGFFVAGGGGGSIVVNHPEVEFCYPSETHKILLENDYIVDDRLYELFVNKNLTSYSEILGRMNEKNQNRAKSFIALEHQYKVDFGLVVFKTSSVLAETLVQNDYKRKLDGQSHDERLVEELARYYSVFDDIVNNMVLEIRPERVILVSDHGMTPRTLSINPNILLLRLGFQHSDLLGSIKRRVLEASRRVMPPAIKVMLKKNTSIKSVSNNSFSYDPYTSKAFMRSFGDWRHGIFVNDSKRFGGPVLECEKNKVIADLIEAINNDSQSKAFKLKAHSSKSLFGSNLVSQFPDIVIDCEDGALICETSSSFITPYKLNPNYNALDSMLKLDVAAVKSTKPLCVFHPAVDKSELENIKVIADLPDILIRIFERDL